MEPIDRDATETEPEEDSDHNGLTYGMIGGMMLGTVLFVLTDQVLWLAIGLPLGLAVGSLLDRKRQ